MLDQFRTDIAGLGGMKYYLLLLLFAFGGFIWTEVKGYRILGDDADSRDTRAGRTGQYFYHK